MCFVFKRFSLNQIEVIFKKDLEILSLKIICL